MRGCVSVCLVWVPLRNVYSLCEEIWWVGRPVSPVSNSHRAWLRIARQTTGMGGGGELAIFESPGVSTHNNKKRKKATLCDIEHYKQILNWICMLNLSWAYARRMTQKEVNFISDRLLCFLRMKKWMISALEVFPSCCLENSSSVYHILQKHTYINRQPARLDKYVFFYIPIMWNCIKSI